MSDSLPLRVFRACCAAAILFAATWAEVHAGDLRTKKAAIPDSTATASSRVSTDSLRFPDMVLLGPRDLAEAGRWLPGHYLLRSGSFGQLGELVADGLFRSSLAVGSFLDPVTSMAEPDLSIWPVGFHHLLTSLGPVTSLAGTAEQVVASTPWRATERPYTRIGYTSGAYGLSQVAVRFTQRVHRSVQLWLEGSHDLYQGYEPFSGLRNQLYLWRLAWKARPRLSVRYWGRRFARDVDSPNPAQQQSGYSFLRDFLATKHRKIAWTDHILDAIWRPDTLGQRELRVSVAGGRGRAERAFWGVRCLGRVDDLSEMQGQIVYRQGKLLIFGSLSRFGRSGGEGRRAWKHWRLRAVLPVFHLVGQGFSLSAGAAGGSTPGFRKGGAEAALGFAKKLGPTRARLDLFSDAWLPALEASCLDVDPVPGGLVRRNGARLKLEGRVAGWEWTTSASALRATNLPGLRHTSESGFSWTGVQRASTTFSLALVRSPEHTFFGRAKLDFYSNPLPGIPTVYGLAAFGVRRVLFQGDLDVRVLGLAEFVSEREAALPFVLPGGERTSESVRVPAGVSPSVRVVARFKDARLFFEVSQFLGQRLERVPGFRDDPLAYRWGVWWEFWN